MPTAIAVTSADLVLPPTDHQTPTAALLPPPDAQPLDAAVADAQVLIEQHGHLLVLYPASLPAAHQRRLHTVRAVLETDRIALLKTDLPPLGLAVLVRQMRQLSYRDLSPGVLASAARLLSHYVYAGALLHSVARLDRVPVDLGSHARSWMPGSQFAVLANPTPTLVKAGAPDAALPGPEFATALVVARGQSTATWVTDALAPAWRVQPVAEAPLPDASARWWGTAKLVEFAAYLPDPSVLYRLVASVRRETCSWCGGDLIGDRCGFCAAPVPTPEDARPAVLAAAPGAHADGPALPAPGRTGPRHRALPGARPGGPR
ncbi:hypothetical protein C6N75_26175 [Streptomyces solincola]|uniref:Uncharacterized protein n=1 Tax=Streptomyces solincola TaxID=2100817 RepID=A0A2S9PPK4_9ACTN|nr:hypothetical protein [Streptomyces solincola]PRH76334.1 hypothetical protein C6N75_26175 [Streptomyces solincola]